MTDQDESLWQAGLELIRELQEQGYEAFLVGGCVRDRLLGRSLKDIDIATDALPEQVTAAFARTLPTGLKHGTVTVLREGRPFEVTTYRTESGYADARRPDRVQFVADLSEDLARRDFTFNAMAVGLSGEIVDPFGGRKDLEERSVRCVGNAFIRFGEDALRMVRAIRFAAEFGFNLKLSVWRAIRSQASRLRQVAMERIGSEWDKMMGGTDPERACCLLSRSGLLRNLKESLPERLISDKRGQRETGFRRLGDISETDRRWIAWLADAGASAEETRLLCRALRFSGKREMRIAAAISFHTRMTAGSPNRSAFVRAVLDLGKSAAEDWLETRMAGGLYREWLDELALDSVGQLAVKGDELAAFLNKPAGPWVARLLRRLLEEAVYGRILNEKEALLIAASEMEGT